MYSLDMRTNEPSDAVPRLRPIPPDQWDDDVVVSMREAFPASAVEAFRTKGPVPNVLATMAHNPVLAGPFNRFGNVLLQEPAMSHRARELMLLRVAWRTRARYEWVHHVRLAEHYGLDAADIAGVVAGACDGWSALEQDLIAATDQLLDHYRIDDETWGRLSRHLDERQLVELPFVVGTYTCLAMAFNSWNLQVEEGVDTTDVPPLPDGPSGS